jgi:LuxR family transcriptional regulator, maltose regulon positive regulatory protein
MGYLPGGTVTTPILLTKLYFPASRSSLASRPQLVERLHQGLQGPLTLISAPAGSGKTTLLSEWRAGPGAGLPVAYISLDERDNDPACFLSYLVAALERLQSGLASTAEGLLQAGRLPTIETITTSLLVDMQDYPQDFYLVLDDFHVIHEPGIHEGITALIEGFPPQVHLAILTRSDPPLPLSRLRLSGRLVEIRLAHLRFSYEEAAAFLNQIMGLELNPEQVAALEARSEGWIAGLQLAALSMQGQDTNARADFIADFTGSHHYILDYLAEEALNRQPEEIRDFLLRTSILERLCGPLCNELTGRQDGSETLLYLERNNLFLVPLDDERHWYRYHQLFTDMLANRLRQKAPGEIPTLHQRASTWYELNHLPDDAIRHALKAKDYARAASLLRLNNLQLMYTRSLTTLAGWLNAFPEETIRSDPWLGIARLHLLWSTGQREGLETHTRESQAALNAKLASGELDEADPDYVWLLGETLSFQSLSILREDTQAAIELAQQAVAGLPRQAFPHGFALGALYMAFNAAGQFDQVIETCWKAIQVTKALRYPSMLATATASLGGMLILKGRLHQAVQAYRETLQFAENHGLEGLFYFGIVHVTLADVLREWNQLDEAEMHANTGLAQVRQGGLSILMVGRLLSKAWLRYSHGSLQGTLEEIDRIVQECSRMHPDTYRPATTELRIRCLADLGKMIEVESWVKGVDQNLEVNPSPERCRDLLLAGRSLGMLGRTEEAMHVLEQLESFARDGGHNGLLVITLSYKALAWAGENQTGRALECLQEALALAEPEGYVRTFANEGARMRELLKQARQRGIAPHYANRLLAAIDGAGPRVTGQAKPPALLTERELELLELIAEGCTNREIAAKLYIAIGTVKRHTVNIFTKLNAANRTDAVAKARGLSILS